MYLIPGKKFYSFNCKRGVKPLKVKKTQPTPKEKRKKKKGFLDADLLIHIRPLEHSCRRSDPKKILKNKAPPPEATPAPKDVQSVTPGLRYDLSKSSATFGESKISLRHSPLRSETLKDILESPLRYRI